MGLCFKHKLAWNTLSMAWSVRGFGNLFLFASFFYKWNIATSYDKRGKQIMLNSSFQLQYDVDFTVSLGSNFV